MNLGCLNMRGRAGGVQRRIEIARACLLVGAMGGISVGSAEEMSAMPVSTSQACRAHSNLSARSAQPSRTHQQKENEDTHSINQRRFNPGIPSLQPSSCLADGYRDVWVRVECPALETTRCVRGSLIGIEVGIDEVVEEGNVDGVFGWGERRFV